jgi:MFS family permease
VSGSDTHRRGLRVSLAHRDFRYLFASRAISGTGDWLYNVALLVYVFERTHSPGWVAAASVAKLFPVVAFGALGGVIADRFERRTVMIVSDLVRAGLMAALALVVAAHGPVLLVAALAAVSTLAATPYIPAIGALTPELVPESDLGPANALMSTADNLTIVIGPAVGSILLLLGSAVSVFTINAATFLVSAVLVARISVRSKAEAREGSIAGRLAEGYRAIASSGELVLLVLLALAFTFIFGQELVLFPLLAARRLGIGSEGAGWLLAASGLGSVLGAPLASRLSETPRSARVLLGAVFVSGLPLISLSVIREPVLAGAVLLIEGAAVVVADVVTTTTIQRVAPPELTARVFGVLISSVVVGILLGSLLAPLTVSAFGLPAALVLAGCVLLAGTIATLPRVRALDADATGRAATLGSRLELLTRVPVFEGLPRRALEALAQASVSERVERGTAVVAEGDPADAFYVVASGELRVTATAEHTEVRELSRLGPGDWFGEIGLLEGIPRTATVEAVSECELLRIDAEAFLDAVSSFGSSLRTLASVESARLAQTHPGHRPRFGLAGSG